MAAEGGKERRRRDPGGGGVGVGESRTAGGERPGRAGRRSAFTTTPRPPLLRAAALLPPRPAIFLRARPRGCGAARRGGDGRGSGAGAVPRAGLRPQLRPAGGGGGGKVPRSLAPAGLWGAEGAGPGGLGLHPSAWGRSPRLPGEQSLRCARRRLISFSYAVTRQT